MALLDSLIGTDSNGNVGVDVNVNIPTATLASLFAVGAALIFVYVGGSIILSLFKAKSA